MIGNGIPKTVYSQFISDLTGYGAEKNRQDLSHIEKEASSTDRMRIQSSDYDEVKKSIGRKLLNAIIADYEDRFSQ